MSCEASSQQEKLSVVAFSYVVLMPTALPRLNVPGCSQQATPADNSSI